MSAQQLCALHDGPTVVRIDQTLAPATRSFSSALIHSPGIYQYNEFRYDCSQEGLYTWFAPMVDTTNRIMYAGNIYALMSGLAWLCVHGTADEGLSDKHARSRTSILRMRCGYTVEFARSILTGLGMPSRVVRVLTAGALNGYDEGHVVIEVCHGGVWKLWDLSSNCYFTGLDGSHLSLLDLIDAVAADSFSVVPIAGDAYSIEPFVGGSFDVTAFCRLVLSDARAWIRRIYQIPLVGDVAYVPEAHSGRALWVSSLGYSVLPKAQWLSTFYAWAR